MAFKGFQALELGVREGGQWGKFRDSGHATVDRQNPT